MKGTLDRFSTENPEKDAQIKRKSKQIANLTKKLEKWMSKAFNKGSGGKDSKIESTRNEQFNNAHKPKKKSSLSSMSAE